MSAPTRRHALTGLLGLSGCALCAQGAFAQIDLGALGRMAKAAGMGEKDELSMAAKFYGPSIDAMGGAYPNSSVQAAVRRIAEPILKTSARSAFGWEITVVDSNEVNAWALPGGKLGVCKGLLRYVDNEDELAAVIAHEMGHAEMSHALKEMKGKALTGAALGAATAAASSSSSRDNRVEMGAGLVGLDLSVLALAASGYSRENEREADRHIATVFARTGHSVQRGAGFYRTLLELIPERARGRTSLFAGHPQTKERLAELTALAPGAASASRPSPAFAEVKTAFPTRRAYMRG